MNKGYCCNGSYEKMSSMMKTLMSHEKFNCTDKCMEMMQKFLNNNTGKTDSSHGKCNCFNKSQTAN